MDASSTRGKIARPLIGITTMREEMSFGEGWTSSMDALDVHYTELVAKAGGLPVLLPETCDDVAGLVHRLDGIIITGGYDIDPSQYGADRHEMTDPPRKGRDDFELSLANAAVLGDVPLLCICRGIQVLNVARGGTLHQHLPDVVGHDDHAGTPGKFTSHEVITEDGSTVASIFGQSDVVPAYHHQAIDGLGEGLRISAHTSDGVVEAVELNGSEDLLGLQWHPEQGDDVRPFAWLIERSIARMEVQRSAPKTNDFAAR